MRHPYQELGTITAYEFGEKNGQNAVDSIKRLWRDCYGTVISHSKKVRVAGALHNSSIIHVVGCRIVM